MNSYKEQDEYKGKSVANFNADGGDFIGVKFAVVNLTIKNTSTELFIPFDKKENNSFLVFEFMTDEEVRFNIKEH
ncbi:hypothetical protein GCM10008934_17080 [Virgibacillus salarius]|uniref:hypothetical protein n=1 Tax=Virgibacillus salarius TaxID=447199 RepID=UPI0031CEE597